jgi:uncharacterized membrane protein
LYAILLVAFLLRAHRLADKNIWWDEGWSVWLSQKDLAWIALRTAMDEHPPLHYWMLHFWNFIAGTDAFAGRFVSLAFGVLTIALIYRIGKKVGESPGRHPERSEGSRSSNSEILRRFAAQNDTGLWVGILAALFLATARFHIWWSQDIKNYTPSIFFAFAAVWFALNLISDLKTERSQFAIRYSLFGYALCAALAMWTHYLAALILLALNLYALIIILCSSFVFRPSFSVLRLSSVWLNWLIANLLAAALFAPWLYLYLQNAASWQAAPIFDFTLFLKLVATVLPLGVTTNIENYVALTIVFTALAAIPAFSILYSVFRRKGKPEHWTLNTEYCLLFTLIVIFPPLLVYALSLTPVSFFAPKIQARYLLILLPAYSILLALGVAFLARFSRYFAIAATLFIIATSTFVLNDYYADRRLRDEYTTLANTINAFARQGDLVLLDTDQEWPTFLYYLRAPLDWLGVPNGKPMTDADADVLVRRALNRNSAVWLVAIPDALATDPRKMIEARLERELQKQFEGIYDDKRLMLYSATPRDLTNVPAQNFSPQYARVDQIASGATLIGYDLPVREVAPGDVVRLVTYWQNSLPAVVSLNQTRTPLPVGERARMQTNLIIPADAVGDFVFRIGTMDLARVYVEPRKDAVAVGAISHTTDHRLSDAIRLIGYDLPTTRFRAGESVPITLYWRADRAVEKSYTVFVHLRGETFNPKQNNPLWGQADRVPSPPTNAWLSNEIVPDAYRIAVDRDAPPGKYAIVVGMYDAATGARLPTDNGDSILIAEIQIVP